MEQIKKLQTTCGSTICIRPETAQDYETVEQLTRAAFYNLYMPGCSEHYLVRNLRSHPDFIPELDLVLELDGRIIGSIMYTKATLTDEAGAKKKILTFGPLCIAPEFQRQGYGKLLLEDSFERAVALCYDVIVIFGVPANYVSRGFQSCKKWNISIPDGRYPAAMMVKELMEGALSSAHKHWIYRQSSALDISEEAALAYDDTLKPMERRWQPSQEEFYILSNSFLS